MTFSPLEILQAGANTRNGTDLELFMEVEDALTPKCGHSYHNTQPNFHGGEVHRLVKLVHPCRPVREFYICDGFWDSVLRGFPCMDCHQIVNTANYIVLAVF